MKKYFICLLFAAIIICLASCSEKATVYFDLNGGNIDSGSLNVSVKTGEVPDAPLVSKEGYVFDGWDGSLENITEDTVIRAKWIKLHKVTFDPDGGTLISGNLSQDVKEGESAEEPELEKEGFLFTGWDCALDEIKEDITIKAAWKPEILSPTQVYDTVKLGTVEIITYNKKGEEYSLGSGFFISSNGEIVTNYHVIEDAYAIDIIMNDNTEHSVTNIIAYDENLDLAIINIMV